MMKKISILAATAALLTTIGCVKSPQHPELIPYRDYQYKFQDGEVTKEFKGQSDYIVLALPGDENSYGCHANLFSFLEKSLEDIKFIARKERAGLTDYSTFGNHKFVTFDQEDNFIVHTYAEITDLPFKDRKRKVNEWVNNRQYPSTFPRNPDYQNRVDADPMLPEVLLGSLYQTTMIGVDYSYREQVEKGEDKDLAAFIAEREKTNPNEKNNTFTYEKNWIAVNVLDYYASKIEKGNLVPFISGYIRLQEFTEQLETAGISFKMVEFDPCVQWYKDNGKHEGSKL